MNEVYFPKAISPNAAYEKEGAKSITLDCFSGGDFVVAISKNWLPRSRSSTEGYVWKHVDLTGASIRVMPFIYEREIAPGDLLGIQLTLTGRQILKRNDDYSLTGTISDVLSQDGENQLWRQTILRNGDQFVLVSGVCQSLEYSSVADDFFLALASARFARPDLAITSRPLNSILSSTKGLPKFSLPASWTLAKIEHSEGRITHVLRNGMPDRAIGEIGLQTRQIVSSARGEDILQNHFTQYKAGLAERKIACGPCLLHVAKPLEGFELAVAATFPLSSSSARWDESLIIHWRRDCLLEIRMTSPNRVDDCYTWAENKRSLELLLATIDIDVVLAEGESYAS